MKERITNERLRIVACTIFKGKYHLQVGHDLIDTFSTVEAAEVERERQENVAAKAHHDG